MKIKDLGHWVKDEVRAAYTQGYGLFRNPPRHFLEQTKENKAPIILIQGVLSSWHSLRRIADKLSLEGHPVYILPGLGRNTKDISKAAELVHELIEEKNLKNVIIVAHSKGGLIGKYLLAHLDSENRIKKLIAIATPFAGSKIVKLLPFKVYREVHPNSKIIGQLKEEKEANKKIVSIYGIFDNHVWPLSSSHLAGAKNIQVEVRGHHSILFDKKVSEIVLTEANAQ